MINFISDLPRDLRFGWFSALNVTALVPCPHDFVTAAM
jgi:hypothetical protein